MREALQQWNPTLDFVKDGIPKDPDRDRRETADPSTALGMTIWG
jgi:hypothetical protein